MKTLLVALGAAIGANARYWLGVWIADRWHSRFPWATMVVNVSGSLLIGLMAGLAMRRELAVQTRLLVGVGLLGGYTTFSTFSQETLLLFQGGHATAAAWNVFGSVGGGLLACWIGVVAGFALGNLVWR